MRTKILILAITIIFVFVNPLFSQPNITDVDTTVGEINKFEKFEISFNVFDTTTLFSNPLYSNPYDPDTINVSCTFKINIDDIDSIFEVQAFYYTGYTRDTISCTSTNPVYPCELLNVDYSDDRKWKIRFTPHIVGKWDFIIKAKDKNPDLSIYEGEFECIESSKKGFIVKANDKYLKRTTGEFLFPVGENIPTYRAHSNTNYGTFEYEHYIDELYGNANFIRVWLDLFNGMALVGEDYRNDSIYSFDSYNQKDAWQLDYIFEYAKSKDIDIMLCIFNASSWALNNPYGNSWPSNNAFANTNGGPIEFPYEFFTDPDAIKKTKDLMSYIIARWGYSTNLLAWELWNEVNMIDDMKDSLPIFPTEHRQNIFNWHDTIYNYITKKDAFDHLITTSVAGPLFINADSLDNTEDYFTHMDIMQSHDYKSVYTDSTLSTLFINHDFQDHFYQVFGSRETKPQIPYISGEWGFDVHKSINGGEFTNDVDPYGFELHSTLWSSAFSGSLGTPTYWFWDSYTETADLYSIFKPIKDFMNSIPLPSDSFTPHQIWYKDSLRSYYMMNKNTDTIYGWTQAYVFRLIKLFADNPDYLINLTDRPDIPDNGQMIIIDNIKEHENMPFMVEWYDSETLELFSKSKVTCKNETILLELPMNDDSTKYILDGKFADAVFKVYLDCDQNMWRENILTKDTPENVQNEIVCCDATSQVFYKTNNNKIQSNWWDNVEKTWKWSNLNNQATNVAGPSLTSLNSGDLSYHENSSQVFYRTTDSSINSIKWDLNIENWAHDSLNNATGNSVKGPILVSPSGKVFYRNYDNNLNMISYDSTTENWEWSNLGGATKENVGSYITLLDENQVFFVTNDQGTLGKLRSVYKDINGFWNMSLLDNAASSNVAGNITITHNGQVFYRTCDNKLNNIYWTPPSFPNSSFWSRSELNHVASNVEGDIIADNVGKVFYRTSDSNINCIYWHNDQWNRSELDNATNNNVLPCSLAIDDHRNVFYKGDDNKVHMIYYRSVCDYSSFPYTIKKSITNNYDFKSWDNILNTNKFDFIAFPNPANNVISIKSYQDISQLEIYNMNGRSILVKDNLIENNIQVNISNFLNGIYFIKVSDNFGNSLIKKIIISHR